MVEAAQPKRSKEPMDLGASCLNALSEPDYLSHYPRPSPLSPYLSYLYCCTDRYHLGFRLTLPPGFKLGNRSTCRHRPKDCWDGLLS